MRLGIVKAAFDDPAAFGASSAPRRSGAMSPPTSSEVDEDGEIHIEIVGHASVRTRASA